MPLLLIPVFVVIAAIALIPFSLVQRYRMGTARQRARGWLAIVNLVGLSLSVWMFLLGATVTTFWVPRALSYSLAGLGAGCALGIVGLLLTRWEPAREALFFTPNRLLVLTITLVVSARILYGFWRSVHAWRAGMDSGGWFGASGLAGSMAAGAVVLGYYLIYWIGVRWRLTRWLRAHGSRLKPA